MAIDPISAVNNIVSSQSTNSTVATGGTASDEQNMFMDLLVAQLKNQDPLSPQDSTAFVAQLAQFNSLDQLVGIRDSIDKLTQLLQQNQQTTAAASVTN
jgi:flagellar basal-body rod modification protein FlgD